jgi:hypothetical protein
MWYLYYLVRTFRDFGAASSCASDVAFPLDWELETAQAQTTLFKCNVDTHTSFSAEHKLSSEETTGRSHHAVLNPLFCLLVGALLHLQ